MWHKAVVCYLSPNEFENLYYNNYTQTTFVYTTGGTSLLNKKNTYEPKSITVDANPSYILAFTQLQKEGKFSNTTMRKNKYLNNIIEQDHRRVKWKTKDAMGYHSYKTAYNTIRGIETINMLFKGQLYHLLKSSAINIKYQKPGYDRYS